MIDALISMPFDWLENGTGLHVTGLMFGEKPAQEWLP